jgi:hypothetical protein
MGTSAKPGWYVLWAAVGAAAWFGLSFGAPALMATGIPAVILRVVVIGVVLFGLWRGLSRTGWASERRTAVWLAVAVPLVAWFIVMWVLGVRGTFHISPDPLSRLPIPVAVVLPVAVGLMLLLRSRAIATVLDDVPASWLIGLQVYRVIGAGFLANWLLGSAPAAFALPAGIGDVTVGLLALPTALAVASGTEAGRRAGIRWNLLGLTDFVVALTTGFLTSAQLLGNQVPNTIVGTYPTVLIPTFIVPMSILLHAMSLWQLRRLGAHLHVGHVVGLGRLGQV